jgi:predicted nucleic acid-binding protein
MRIVRYTNVLVAGLLSATGPPAAIVEAVIASSLDLAIDMAIRQEYEEVLGRPEFAFPAPRVESLLAVIDRFAVWVAAAPPWPVALPDPEGEPFLAVAAASGSVLVTGNTGPVAPPENPLGEHRDARLQAGPRHIQSHDLGPASDQSSIASPSSLRLQHPEPRQRLQDPVDERRHGAGVEDDHQKGGRRRLRRDAASPRANLSAPSRSSRSSSAHFLARSR